MTILAIGVDCDPTMVHFLRHCRREGVEVDAINLREVALAGSWRLGIPGSDLDVIEVGGRRWELGTYDAVYSRPIDLTWQQRDSDLRNRWLGLMAAMTAWLSCTDTAVVNRPVGGAHNSAKSLHESLIARLGLRVPASVSSSNPETLAALGSGATVAKASGGGRGDTQLVTERQLRRSTSDVPVHVQTFIPGRDVRAHVVGSEVISVVVDSDVVDYRVPNSGARFTAWTLPSDLADTIVAGTRSFGLSFAGWDFKLAPDGCYWCLEANPQPGYSMYDRYVNGAISTALVHLLSGADGDSHPGT